MGRIDARSHPIYNEVIFFQLKISPNKAICQYLNNYTVIKEINIYCRALEQIGMRQS